MTSVPTRILPLLVLALSAFVHSAASAADADPAMVEQVGAKTTPSAKMPFAAPKYGVVGDGKTLNTQALQKAIDAAAKKGGIVTLAPGEYLTGSLFLKKGVTLHLDKGVTLLGSQDLKDYPEMKTRVAGIEMVWPAALLNTIDQDNVAITGEGTMDGQGKPLWDKYWAMRKELRPQGPTIEMNGMGVAILLTMNWNQVCSYSTLPEGYTQETLLAHWKTMLTKVDPAQGIPHFRDVVISNVRAQNAKIAISAEGQPNSPLEGTTLENVTMTAETAGGLNYAKDWVIKNVTVTAKDDEPIAVQNSSKIKF